MVIQLFIAVGTIMVAVVAIWGNWIKFRLFPPVLSIEPHNKLHGTLTNTAEGKKIIYYHLKVVNQRSWMPADNCRVYLRSLFKRAPNGDFITVPISIPLLFVWAPLELMPPSIKLTKEEIFDFGVLKEGSNYFQPQFYVTTNDFKGNLYKNETMRYALEIKADGYISSKYQVFEVSWDGKWTDNLEELSRSLIIKDVTDSIVN